MYVVVWNIEHGKECKKALDCLFTKGIKRICLLNGGINAVLMDAPELIKKKVKVTPLNYFKRKQ